MRKVIKEDCFKYFPGIGCTLPLSAGHYGTRGPLRIKLPDNIKIPSILKTFLNGGVKIHESVIVNGDEAICTDTEIYIKT